MIKIFFIILFYLISFSIFSENKKSFLVIKAEVKTNLIKMFSVKTNMLSGGYTEEMFYNNVADVCAKYFYINYNIPFIQIEPQVITIKDGKISLTEIRKMTIWWKHPEKNEPLILLSADVKSNLLDDKIKDKKIFRGTFLFSGLNYFDNKTEMKNYTFIGVGVNWFNLFNFSIDTSIMYNGYITGGIGIGYVFKSLPFGFSGGIAIGSNKPSYFFGIKCKLF